MAKQLDPRRFDFLFVLTGTGRRWLIPSGSVDGVTGITVGGSKYAEYEIEPARPIRNTIYGDMRL